MESVIVLSPTVDEKGILEDEKMAQPLRTLAALTEAPTSDLSPQVR